MTNKMLAKYPRVIRPIVDQSKPIVVYAHIELNEIVSVDISSQQVYTITHKNSFPIKLCLLSADFASVGGSALEG